MTNPKAFTNSKHYSPTCQPVVVVLARTAKRIKKRKSDREKERFSKLMGNLQEFVRLPTLFPINSQKWKCSHINQLPNINFSHILTEILPSAVCRLPPLANISFTHLKASKPRSKSVEHKHQFKWAPQYIYVILFERFGCVYDAHVYEFCLHILVSPK